MARLATTSFLVLALGACAAPQDRAAALANRGRPRRPISVDHGKVLIKEGRRLLWGGKDPASHFDLADAALAPARLHYGIGREVFPALTAPRFEPAESARSWLGEGDRVLALKLGGEVRVYPVSLLERHEVVNDEVGGVPIFAAYCELADLGAVYERTVAGSVRTFALSGYTYFDPAVWDGRDGFLLWDRETESLWWPPEGLAVSGPLNGTPLKVLDRALWAQTTWGEVRRRHPQAKVLVRGQEFAAPSSWPRDTGARGPGRRPERVPADAVAPRWGENPSL